MSLWPLIFSNVFWLCSPWNCIAQNRKWIPKNVGNSLRLHVKCRLSLSVWSEIWMSMCFGSAVEHEVWKLIRSLRSKSGCFDVVHAFLRKECMDEFAPIVRNVITLSLLSSTIPSVLQSAIVTPILKKPTTNPDDLSNCRPVSNLQYMAKLFERVVVHRLRKHRWNNRLCEQ